MTTIMVIDDDIAFLARVSTLLTENAYDVMKYNEIAPAEAMLREQQPDLILLETKIGREVGWRLLEEVAEQLPVIVLSALSREEDIVRGLSSGAVDYIAKPYRTDELLARVHLRLQQAAVTHPRLVGVAVPSITTDNSQPEPTEMTPMLQDAFSILNPPDPPATFNPTATNPPPTQPTLIQSQRQKDDAVFMSEDEERALLEEEEETVANDPAAASSESIHEEEEIGLGERLRSARKLRRATLVQAENELRIRMSYLQAMEEENFTMLPRGKMAEQMLRSYATYLDVPADWVLKQYRDQFVANQPDPVPAFTSTRRWSPPRWLIWLLAILLALVVSGYVLYQLDPTGLETIGESLRQLFSPLW